MPLILKRPDGQVEETHCSGYHGAFAGEVHSAIDAKLGIPAGEYPS